jgi:transcriptional regulator with XRE-family HTH domain
MTTQGRPFANTRLAKYLQKRILELRPVKTQLEIAAQSGFRSVNMLSMVKSGRTRLPLDRVPALSEALDADPKLIFTMALEQTWGSTTSRTIDEIFNAVVTDNERAWLEEIRDASGQSDPALTTRARSALRAIFGR